MMSTLLRCALTLPRLRPTDLVRRALTRTLTPLPVLPPVLITPLRCDLTPLRLHRTDLALRALTRTLTRTPLLVLALVLITLSRCDLTRPRLRRTDLALRALTRTPLLVLVRYERVVNSTRRRSTYRRSIVH